ncbi:energy-coupling factor transporter transmembrane component T family protein [Vibrio algarum]|uniref:Energy-coupling factor transporter transmembrane component T n=1 Tax=Vibrio algarum TaxID=3020714 RepID=A0ABT4YWX1_9VIBR|nr:energy-coupling factor transporter transmembrane component T [Vibrio sp. KJ40-1]MDB1125880.1 energy-coupling factor transporter transmembrane component T [Vibrio sp. KJ40-1]
MNTSKMSFGINYIDTGSPLHRLNGITKLVMFLAWVTVVLITFDLRIILSLICLGLLLLKISRIPFKVYRPLVIGTGSVLLLNAFFMYLLAPQQGSILIGSENILLELPGNYTLTKETLFYLSTITLKYFSMFPIALVFVFSTHPTEFAASLCRIGVPYKIAYAVSLTLRYLPEVKKDFINITHAQQARGVDLSKNTSLFMRMKNVSKILGPLIFSSLDRADEISNAMVLRGFGRHKTRTWYSLRPLTSRDITCLVVIGVCVVLSIAKRIMDDTLFWYPM